MFSCLSIFLPRDLIRVSASSGDRFEHSVIEAGVAHDLFRFPLRLVVRRTALRPRAQETQQHDSLDMTFTRVIREDPNKRGLRTSCRAAFRSAARESRLLNCKKAGIGSDPDARGFEGLVLSPREESDFRGPLGDPGILGLARHLEVSLGGHVEPTALARHLADQEAVQDLAGQLLLRQGRLPRRLRPDRSGRRLCGGLRDRSSER